MESNGWPCWLTAFAPTHKEAIAIASNGLQPGEEDAPAFPESDAPAIGADLEEVARYARKRGNSFKGITSARTSYSAAAKGMHWYDTTLDVEFLHDGSGWVPVLSPEKSFTPSFSGITLGNGTRGGIYSYVGPNLIWLRAFVELGSTSSVTGTVKLTTPVTASVSGGTPPHDAMMRASVSRPGVFFAPLFPFMVSTSEIEILAGSASGTYVNYSALSSSIPGTWGPTARLTISGIYKGA